MDLGTGQIELQKLRNVTDWLEPSSLGRNYK